jgi:hypothetical protein
MVQHERSRVLENAYDGKRSIISHKCIIVIAVASWGFIGIDPIISLAAPFTIEVAIVNR